MSKRINARIQKWRSMINQGLDRDPQLVKSRIRKGIPTAVRAIAWPAIVKLKDFIQKHDQEYSFEKLINFPSKSTHEISLDIPRTFPEEEDSKVLRKSLNNVLKAISLVYPNVGYCQGMNFLVLRLLQIIDDQQTFWIINYLLRSDKCLMRNYIDPTLIEEETFVFSQLMKKFLPSIMFKLNSHLIVIQIFTVKWFMTLFSAVLRQELFYRVFEAYLHEGWPVLYQLGLTLLRLTEDRMMKNSFEANLLLINSSMYDIENIDDFMEEVFKMKISNAEIDEYVRLFKAEQQQRRPTETHRSKPSAQKEKAPLLPVPQDENQQKLQILSKAQPISFKSMTLLANTNFKQ